MSDRIQERLGALLNEFRSDEPAAPDWLSTPDAREFLRAWTQLPPDIGEPLFLGQAPMHRHNRWPYAWKYRRVDHAKLAALSRLPETTVRDLFLKLSAARLIYPDGTLSKAATLALASAHN